MTSKNPTAFISHASEDKERFVINFAERLRKVGIDAWLDKWEMHPGDSLVDKIFEDGIKNGSHFIIVLSRNSVSKPWVREELNTAVVEKINKNLRIIPVVLDGVTVPECLRSTLYENISDVSSYDNSFIRIKNSILDISEKPPLGKLPDYLNNDAFSIHGLTRLDSVVLMESCSLALEKDTSYLETQELFGRILNQGISNDELFESLDVLDDYGYIKGHKTIDGLIHYYDVKYLSIRQYALEKYPNFGDIETQIAVSIANGQSTDQIARDLNCPTIIMDGFMEHLHLSGYVECFRMMDGHWEITRISPRFKRMLRS